MSEASGSRSPISNAESITSSSDSASDSGCETNDALFESYNALMRSRLPSVPPVHAASPDLEQESPDLARPMSKAEKQNAKKRRRKERERQERQAQGAADQIDGAGGVPGDPCHGQSGELIEFRLFSGESIRPLRVNPAPECYPLPRNPRLNVPHPGKIEEIRKVAAEIGQIWSVGSAIAQTEDPSLQMLGHPLRTIVVNDATHSATSLRNIMRIHLQENITQLRAPDKSKPSATRIPQVSATFSTSTPSSSREVSTRQRRRLTATARSAHSKSIPLFWAPASGLGGKARGYGMGYRSSQEGRREMGGQYLRGS